MRELFNNRLTVPIIRILVETHSVLVSSAFRQAPVIVANEPLLLFRYLNLRTRLSAKKKI